MTELQKINNFLFKKYDKLVLRQNIMFHDKDDKSINIIEIIMNHVNETNTDKDLFNNFVEKKYFNTTIEKQNYFNIHIKPIILNIYNSYSEKQNLIPKKNLLIYKLLEIIKEDEYKINTITNKKKKKTISSTIKRLVWNIHIGEDYGKAKCICCKTTDITQLSFNCGHIIAEINGGELIVSNLKPICQNCNSSMGTKNMDEFMKDFV